MMNKKILAALLLMTILCIFLELSRLFYTHTISYIFLLWNLFLAWLPLFFSLLFQKKIQESKQLQAILFLFLWLVFFPNAPYMITDLIHLKNRYVAPLWFDSLLVFSFAVNGLLLGVFSLLQIQLFFKKILSPFVQIILQLALLGLCGVGIYLGRVERWNSWDILHSPDLIIQDALQIFIHPFTNKEACLFSFIFSISIFSFYQLFLAMSPTEREAV